MERENIQLEEKAETLEPRYKRSEEDLAEEDRQTKLKLRPVKIANNLWQYFVYGFDMVEIFVYDKFPTIEMLAPIKLTEEGIKQYTEHKNYEDVPGGRCKGFKDGDRNVIIVLINDAKDLIDHLTTASHELNHCAHRILDFAGNKENLMKYEESHCYIQDWLMETHMTIQIGGMVIDNLYKERDLIWFHVITNN